MALVFRVCRYARLWVCSLAIAMSAAAWGTGSAPAEAAVAPQPWVGTYLVYAPAVSPNPLGTMTLLRHHTGTYSGATSLLWTVEDRIITIVIYSPAPPTLCSPFALSCQFESVFTAPSRRTKTGIASEKHPGSETVSIPFEIVVSTGAWWAVRTS